VHPDVLYHRLPAEVRGQVSPLDVQHFMAKLARTGSRMTLAMATLHRVWPTARSGSGSTSVNGDRFAHGLYGGVSTDNKLRRLISLWRISG
jgi:hypothetical protein